MADSTNATATPLNLFLAHSPFQYFVACHMVNNMSEFGQASNCLLVDPVWPDFQLDHSGWKEVIVCDPPVGGSVVGAGRRMRPPLERALGLFQAAYSFRLFLANVQWPLNNVLRAALVRRKSQRPIDVCNYPEGVGSLRLVYPDWRQQFRDRLKSALGLISGVRYQALKEDLMGLETSVRIYSLLPQLLPDELRTKAVAVPPLPLSRGEVDRQTCLFLGQNDRLLPEQIRRPLSVASAAYCRSLPYKRFVFKSHHYGESDMQREAFSGYNFEILRDSRPVEQILAESTVACAVSFNSSALVHLKMMYGDRIRCIACFPEQFGRQARLRPERVSSVTELFRKVGVEIYEAMIPGI